MDSSLTQHMLILQNMTDSLPKAVFHRMPHPFFHLFLRPLFKLSDLTMLQHLTPPSPLSMRECLPIHWWLLSHYAWKTGNRCSQMFIFSFGKGTT